MTSQGARILWLERPIGAKSIACHPAPSQETIKSNGVTIAMQTMLVIIGILVADALTTQGVADCWTLKKWSDSQMGYHKLSNTGKETGKTPSTPGQGEKPHAVAPDKLSDRWVDGWMGEWTGHPSGMRSQRNCLGNPSSLGAALDFLDGAVILADQPCAIGRDDQGLVRWYELGRGLGIGLSHP